MDSEHTLVPTPYNSASKEQIAKTVIMPGDPMRSKWIADNFLENAELVNNIRGAQGYTGTWKGHPVTVMSSGVGIPSMSLYAYELFNFYDVDVIIRTGTAGSIREDVDINDVIIADIAETNSNFLTQFALPEDYVPGADGEMLSKAMKAGSRLSAQGRLHVGKVLTEEIYYSQEPDIVGKWAAKGVLAFEMEAAALYANAAQASKKALAVFTVSNNIIFGTEMDPMDRERSLVDMVTLALESAFA